MGVEELPGDYLVAELDGRQPREGGVVVGAEIVGDHGEVPAAFGEAVLVAVHSGSLTVVGATAWRFRRLAAAR
jgi:hypothetical protein